MGDLPVAGEIQRDGFVPIAVGRIDRQGPAAAGIVDQYVDVPQCCERSGRQRFGSILLHDVLRDRDDGGAALGLDLLRKRLEQIFPSRHGDDTHPLHREPLGYGAADPDAGSGHDGGLGLEFEVHVCGFLSVNNMHAC